MNKTTPIRGEGLIEAGGLLEGGGELKRDWGLNGGNTVLQENIHFIWNCENCSLWSTVMRLA